MLLGTFFERVKAALHSQTCLHCEQRSVPVDLLFCRQCREALNLRTPQAVMDTAYFQCHAATTFNPVVKKILYGYKFYDRDDHTPRLAGLLIEYWRQLQLDLSAEPQHPESVLVVPVPAHDPNGNRVEKLAVRFARHFGYEHRMDALFWVRPITPQHNILDKRQRFLNIAGSLQVNWDVVAGHERIVIVDDLTTTGATLHEASRAFRDAARAHQTRLEIVTLAVSKMPLVKPVR